MVYFTLEVLQTMMSFRLWGNVYGTGSKTMI